MAEPAQSAALSESLQDYVEAVYLLVQRHGVARMRDIAGLVGVGKSSATGAIQTLGERGLVNYDPYQYVTLTEKGEAAGREVARRHRILKQFLTEVLAVPDGGSGGRRVQDGARDQGRGARAVRAVPPVRGAAIGVGRVVGRGV